MSERVVNRIIAGCVTLCSWTVALILLGVLMCLHIGAHDLDFLLIWIPILCASAAFFLIGVVSILFVVFGGRKEKPLN